MSAKPGAAAAKKKPAAAKPGKPAAKPGKPAAKPAKSSKPAAGRKPAAPAKAEKAEPEDPFAIKTEQQKAGKPESGLYRLRVHHAIGRLIGRDHDGILYIGQGSILGSDCELNRLVNALNQVEFRHEAGTRYNFGKVPHKYPLTELIVEVELCKDAENRWKAEMEKYVYKFGELPPLNHQESITLAGD